MTATATTSIMQRFAEDQIDNPELPATLLASSFNLLTAVRAAIVANGSQTLERIDSALDLITWGLEHLGDEIGDPGLREAAVGYRELAAFVARRNLAEIDRQLALFAPLHGGSS